MLAPALPPRSAALSMNAIHAALIEWDEKKCNVYADKGDWVSVRKLINGGSLKVPASRLNGLQEFLSGVQKAKKIWPELKPQIELEPVAVIDDPDPSLVLGPSLPKVISAKDLAPVSRKVGLIMRLRNWAMGIGAGGTGLSLADVQEKSGQLHDIAETFKSNAFLLLIGGCVIGVIAASVLMSWIADDHNSGRYLPSKE
jgi:hypothetical protein